MAIYHLLYRTNVAGRVPTAANMPAGRLGLNLVDERIYFTNEAGTVVEPQPRAHTHTVSEITNLATSYLPLTGGQMNGGPIVLGTSSVGTVYGTTTGVTRSAYNLLPSGGRYSATGSVTGAMQILFPPEATTSTTGLICALEVDILQNSGARTPTTMWVDGTYTSGTWSNTSVLTLTGDSVQNLTVRFGVSGGAPAIWIGEVDTAWTTPSFTLISALIKGTTPQASNAVYGVGWNITPVTAFGTVQQTNSDNLPLAKPSAAPTAQLLPTTAHDLNTYTAPGEYYQGTVVAALPEYNYPIQQLGFLAVQTFGTATEQVYTSRVDPSRMFWRTKTGASSWSPWVEVAQASNVQSFNGAIPNAADLNTYVERGLWTINSSAIAASGTNFPAPYSGFMTVMSGAAFGSGIALTSGVTQVYYSANSAAIYTRMLLNSVWTAWAAGSKAANLTTQNLNDVIEAGTYFMNSDASATAALNYPVLLAGVLEVIPAFSGNLQVMQRYTTRSATIPRIFVRNRFTTSQTWFSWIELPSLDTAGKIPAAQIPDLDAAKITSGTFAPARLGSGVGNNTMLVLGPTGVPLWAPTYPAVVTQAGTTLNLSSVFAGSYNRTTSATAVTFNVTTNPDWVAGFEIHFRQAGAGAITFVAGSGVTVNAPAGGSLTTAGAGSTVTLKCVATDTYDLFGQVLAA